MNTHAPIPQEEIGNGSLTLDLGWRGGWQKVTIYGGPYDAKPDGFYGVCVREEQTRGLDIDAHLPIVDFNVPTPAQEPRVNEILLDTFMALLARKMPPVYVGCMGGWGRTGLFLALIAKAAGVSDPVQFVRDNYTSHAVETRQQQTYVANFDVRAIRTKLRMAGWMRRLRLI